MELLCDQVDRSRAAILVVGDIVMGSGTDTEVVSTFGTRAAAVPSSIYRTRSYWSTKKKWRASI